MKNCFTLLFIAGVLCLKPDGLFAQLKILNAADTGAVKTLLSAPVVRGKNLLNAVKDTGRLKQQVGSLKSAAKSKVDAFTKELSVLKKKKDFSINLSLENKNQYNPLPTLNPLLTQTGIPTQSGMAARSGIVSEFNTTGVILLYGVPININYTTSRVPIYGQPGFKNDLFKFDFDPKQFSGMFQNDLEQYYNLRRQVFEGMDLTQYTRKMLATQFEAQWNQQKEALKGYAEEKKLNAFINDTQKL